MTEHIKKAYQQASDYGGMEGRYQYERLRDDSDARTINSNGEPRGRDSENGDKEDVYARRKNSIGEPGGRDTENRDVAKMEEILTLLKFGPWQVILIISGFVLQSVIPLHEFGTSLLNAPMAFNCSQNYDNTSGYGNKCVNEEVFVVGVNSSDVMRVMNSNGTVGGPPSCPTPHYDISVFHTTITSEWHLVCEWQAWRPLYQLVYSVGNIIGTLVSGQLSDSLGRRTTILVGAIVSFPACIIQAVVPWYSLVLVMRTILGITHILLVVPLFTLVMESCPPKSRVLVTLSTSLAAGLSVMLLGGISLLVRDWRQLLLTFSIPSAVLIITAFLMNESPRWLVQRGRGQKAGQMLRKAACINNHGNRIPPALTYFIEHLEKEGCSGENKSNSISDGCSDLMEEVKECVRSPSMRYILLAASILSFANRALWLAIPLNANNFTSSVPQLYMMMFGAADLISVLFGFCLTENLPRRVLLSSTHAIVALCFLANIFVPQDYDWIGWVLVMSAACLVALAYEVSLVYYVELMPTVFRSRGITYIELCGYLGGLVIPVLTDILAPIAWWLVDVSLIVAGVLAALVTLLLPETRHLPLPDTIHDVEDRHRRWWGKRRSFKELCKVKFRRESAEEILSFTRISTNIPSTTYQSTTR